MPDSGDADQLCHDPWFTGMDAAAGLVQFNRHQSRCHPRNRRCDPLNHARALERSTELAGKWTTLAQMLVVPTALLHLPGKALLVGVAACFTVLSGLGYIRQGIRCLGDVE